MRFIILIFCIFMFQTDSIKKDSVYMDFEQVRRIIVNSAKQERISNELNSINADLDSLISQLKKDTIKN